MPQLIRKLRDEELSTKQLQEALIFKEAQICGDEILVGPVIDVGTMEEVKIQEHNIVRSFITLNDLSDKPWPVIPHSPIVDGFVQITETALLNALGAGAARLPNPSKLELESVVKDVTGLGLKPKSSDDGYWLNANSSMVQPQGTFLKAVFGPKIFSKGLSTQTIDVFMEKKAEICRELEAEDVTIADMLPHLKKVRR